MGSEHYCLRWNNHQSNLLGVFSQLLQDESLVDVTLACSEGASIRAHKVVLSACSSYFQSLFLDHPSRHPIVILKDVRFSELQTLVEFMYKGEVNVQYCQLSALLKTAESLKVKGLAEMTNQNSALREPEREPDRLRPHSQPKPSSCGETPIEVSGQSTPTPTPQSSSNSSSTVTAINATSLSLKREGEACSPSSPKRLQSSPTPLDLYQRKCPSRSNRDRDRDREPIDPSSMIEDRSPSPCDRPNSIEEDDPMSNDVIGINMSMNPMLSVAGNTSGSVGGSGNSVQSIQQSVVVPPVNSSSSSVDLMRPSSRGGSGGAGTSGSSVSGSGGGGGSNVTLTSTVTHTATSSGLSSPIISTEPVAGPSGLGPVQSVPLSLKKEVDWDRSDEKSTSDTIEYRHSHDSEASESPHGLGGGGNAGAGSSVTGGPSSLDQGGPVYPCMYCGATFPHQSKLTRHILSHSLETLKFRETAHLLHPSHMANLLPPHELSSLPQHFSHRQLPPPLEPLEPPDSGSIDIKFAAAAAAAAAAVSSANVVHVVGGNSTGGGLSISAGGDGSSSLGCPSNDPNSVVLCKFCGKSFPDVASLITHLPVHTGDRPFKCEFCGKAFKLRHHMKDHCRVHTGERPFRCSMCGKTFSRSTILKAHEKTHFPKYVRKFLSPSPIDTKDELPQ
ncbi:protein tramtrack, beta isoform isoform X5 [Hermetia illucens]|uniref:protein tramtrack, beta isoform isoform X5 n=1 Tax=Hermetia illucens TaxID=343691 RepID=UPI0018CC3F05|nr:protein tramtrack, beta isoform isoform X5 [Hermetia illucens]